MKLIKYDIDSSLYHHSEHDYHRSSYRRISTCKSHPRASMQLITSLKEIGDPSRRSSLPRHANLPWTGSFSTRCGCTPPTIAPSLDRSTLEKTILPVVGRAVVLTPSEHVLSLFGSDGPSGINLCASVQMDQEASRRASSGRLWWRRYEKVRSSSLHPEPPFNETRSWSMCKSAGRSCGSHINFEVSHQHQQSRKGTRYAPVSHTQASRLPLPKYW